MSDSNECFFCAENTLEHTYECCKKQCCVNCYDKFYSINKKCPWCRQVQYRSPKEKIMREFVKLHPIVQGLIIFGIWKLIVR